MKLITSRKRVHGTDEDRWVVIFRDGSIDYKMFGSFEANDSETVSVPFTIDGHTLELFFNYSETRWDIGLDTARKLWEKLQTRGFTPIAPLDTSDDTIDAMLLALEAQKKEQYAKDNQTMDAIWDSLTDEWEDDS
jgi:hypothetical protein